MSNAPSFVDCTVQPRSIPPAAVSLLETCEWTERAAGAPGATAETDRSSFAPHTAALAQRALDIAQLAALDPGLCQRVSIELDRQAPRTRR